MLNPDKRIRAALITLFSGITSDGNPVPTYDLQVPKDVSPVPSRRIIFGSQTKSQHNTSKCGHNWQCSIDLDVICEMQNGYADRSIIDDIEEQINNLCDFRNGDISIPPFTVLNTQTLTPQDLSYDTPETSVMRKIVRYQFILNGVTA